MNAFLNKLISIITLIAFLATLGPVPNIWAMRPVNGGEGRASGELVKALAAGAKGEAKAGGNQKLHELYNRLQTIFGHSGELTDAMIAQLQELQPQFDNLTRSEVFQLMRMATDAGRGRGSPLWDYLYNGPLTKKAVEEFGADVAKPKSDVQLEFERLFAIINSRPIPIPLTVAGFDDKDPSVRQKADSLLTLDLLSMPSIPQLIEILGNEDQMVAEWAAFRLCEEGEPAIPALIEALRNENASVRKNSAFALYHMSMVWPINQAIPALIIAVTDRDPSVRDSAAMTLCWLREPAIEILLQIPPEAQQIVLEALRSATGTAAGEGAAAGKMMVLAGGEALGAAAGEASAIGDYNQALSQLKGKLDALVLDEEKRQLAERLLDLLRETVDRYITSGKDEGTIKEMIDSALEMLLDAQDEGLQASLSDERFKRRFETAVRAINPESKTPVSIIAHELDNMRDALVDTIGKEQDKEAKAERNRQELTERCEEIVAELRSSAPGDDMERWEIDETRINIDVLGVERFDSPEAREELLRWYNESPYPLIKISAWWALYRIGINVDPPPLTSENGTGCSLEDFQPLKMKPSDEEILQPVDPSSDSVPMDPIFNIQEEYPWYKPVYLVKVKTEVVESALSDEMKQKKQEILDKLSYQVVSHKDAEILSEAGSETVVMLVSESFQHGRQVFWVDKHGNWYGLKGVGLVDAALGYEGGKTAWTKPEDSRNAGTGLAEVDSEDWPDYTLFLRRASLELKEADIGNSELVAAVRYLELWDARDKRFVNAAEFDWRIPVVDEDGKPELDEKGQPHMVTFVPGVHLIYYGKEPRRLVEYAVFKDHPMFQDFVRLSIARKFGLDFPDNEAYARWLSFRVGQNLARLINLGKAHYYLNRHNILVDGSFVDMESMQDLGDVPEDEARCLTIRDFEFATGSIYTTLKDFSGLSREDIRKQILVGALESIDPGKQYLIPPSVSAMLGVLREIVSGGQAPATGEGAAAGTKANLIGEPVTAANISLLEEIRRKHNIEVRGVVVIDKDETAREAMMKEITAHGTFDKDMVLGAVDEITAKQLIQRTQAAHPGVDIRFIQIQKSEEALILNIDDFPPRIFDDPAVNINSAIHSYLDSV